jgi:transcriptional regulator with XRE-family HTH domain
MVTEKQIAENRIKVILAEQKRTSKWLAEAIGKSDNTVSRWCSNKTQPSIQQLLDIAQTLEVDIRSLIKSNMQL